MNIKFISRNECISCKSKDIKILKSELFTSEIIFNYLQLFYGDNVKRSEEHTSELQSLVNLVCRLLLEKKNMKQKKC